MSSIVQNTIGSRCDWSKTDYRDCITSLSQPSLLVAVRVSKNEFYFHGNLRTTQEGYSFNLFGFETKWNMRGESQL